MSSLKINFINENRSKSSSFLGFSNNFFDDGQIVCILLRLKRWMYTEKINRDEEGRRIIEWIK